MEKPPLRADYERKLVISVRLDFADLSNQFNYSTPSEIARQFAAEETFKQLFVVVDVCVQSS